MASIYKERGKWTVAFSDSTGKRHYRRGIVSKEMANQVANRNEYRKQAAKFGMAKTDEEKHAREAERDLDEHLEDLRTFLKGSRKNTDKYINDTEAAILRVFKAAGILGIGQIDRLRVLRALDSLSPKVSVKDNRLSHARRNRILAAIKRFTSWLTHVANRLPIDPLSRESMLDEQQDRRRVRVIMTGEKMVELIDKTPHEPRRGGMSGIDRAVRYALGFGTGFRQGTLFGLKPEDFNLNNDPPYIRVIPTNTKNRKPKDQTISLELADMLRPWLAGRAKGKPVFSKKPWAKPTLAYAQDLKAIGVEYEQGDGLYCDQHAQRNAYITEVIRVAGLKVAQDLAGHSTPVLTSKYGRMGTTDYVSAVEKLTKLQRKPQERKSRTA